MNLSLMIGILVFIAVSASLSAIEGAVLSLPPDSKEKLKLEERSSSRRLIRLLSSPRELAFTLELATDIALGGLAFLLTVQLITAFGMRAGLWNLLVAPLTLLILGQVIPRAIGARFPLPVLRSLITFMAASHAALRPMVLSIEWVSNLITRYLGRSNPAAYRLEAAEIKSLVNLSEQAGTLNKKESQLIHRVFEFGDTVVSKLMSPRIDIIGFEISTPVEKILEQIKEHRFARYPIYKSSLDNIIGILYTKDLLALHLPQERRKHTLRELLHPIYFVPMTKKADDLFREFQSQKIHLAAVVDEYGGVAGLVTMDDLLSEIFGTFLDERDTLEADYIQVDPETFRVQGGMNLEDFFTLVQMQPPDHDERITTVAGFLMSLTGTIPQEHEVFTFQNLRMTVEKVEGTRIQEILVRKTPTEQAPAANVEAS